MFFSRGFTTISSSGGGGGTRTHAQRVVFVEKDILDIPPSRILLRSRPSFPEASTSK